MKKIGFLINPIAGMGGRVGLKGTDDLAELAAELGAEPVAIERTADMLRHLQAGLASRGERIEFRWLTCSGTMGGRALKDAGFSNIDIVHMSADNPGKADTEVATRACVDANADLMVFCGGDGTARDICRIVGTKTPILGIPSGVKMYSGVFGITPARTAKLLEAYLYGELDIIETEVLDLDEERYRQGEWIVRLYHSAMTPFEPSLTQATKAMCDEHSDIEVKTDIAETVCEEMAGNPERLYFLGPGTTVKSLADNLKIDKTLLGIDAVLAGKQIARDVNETRLLELIDVHHDVALILSPTGAQGFILGRGNLQLSPAVIDRIGIENITILATPAKLTRTPVLRFDTGDHRLDDQLTSRGYWPVLIGYHKRRMVKVSC